MTSMTGSPDKPIDEQVLARELAKAVSGSDLKKVLLLPPDLTRLHSYAGRITAMLYDLLKDRCQVDIMPALGTHDPLSEAECRQFFGDKVPFKSFIRHDWKNDIIKLGEVPAEYVREISDGLLDYPIDVEVNRRLLDPSYDLILSIGQVIPHEVVGMANYSKNIFVGCGGRNMINRTHFLGAVYGMERLMGKDHSPVRKVFDYAETRFIQDIPLIYILTVTTVQNDQVSLEGLFIGRERQLFEKAIQLSQERNLTFLDTPPRKVVAWLDEKEFKSTWIGNKAIYRTRMAIADGGELLILAPGVRKFGEDQEIDHILRRYGYFGRQKILELYRENKDLQENPSAAAHLIHGSSDGRFTITYAVRHMSRDEIEWAGFNYMDLDTALRRYDPALLKDGPNVLPDGEEIYFIRNPAAGLWASRDRFSGQD